MKYTECPLHPQQNKKHPEICIKQMFVTKEDERSYPLYDNNPGPKKSHPLSVANLITLTHPYRRPPAPSTSPAFDTPSQPPPTPPQSTHPHQQALLTYEHRRALTFPFSNGSKWFPGISKTGTGTPVISSHPLVAISTSVRFSNHSCGAHPRSVVEYGSRERSSTIRGLGPGSGWYASRLRELLSNWACTRAATRARVVEPVCVCCETAAMTAGGRPWWLRGGGESIRTTP